MAPNNKDVVSTHRVFVGGLYAGIAEEDLTNRLKKFGNVKNVYIHERQNDQGVITKTFAVLDMDTSEKNLSRCFTAYSNTIWKGNTLRLQKYKEDPFERTKKDQEARRNIEKEEASSLLMPTYIKEGRTDRNQHWGKKKELVGTNTFNTKPTGELGRSNVYINDDSKPRDVQFRSEINKRTDKQNRTRRNASHSVSGRPIISTDEQRQRSMKPGGSTSSSSMSESDEEKVCQGVPKFSGISLRKRESSSNPKGKIKEFSIVSSKYEKLKPVRKDSDEESVATDEIIAVSKASNREIVVSADNELETKKHKIDRTNKKRLKNHGSPNEESNTSNSKFTVTPAKAKVMKTEKTPGSKKGLLGRLEGFSSVWKDASDDENEDTWKSRLDIAGSSKLKFDVTTKDAVGETHENSVHPYKFAQVKTESGDSRFSQKIKTESSPRKFSHAERFTGHQDTEKEYSRPHSFQASADNKKRHAADNYKRLESMKKLQSSLAEKKKTIEISLSAKGDGLPMPNKKIKFDSDGEEEFDVLRKSNIDSKHHMQGLLNGTRLDKREGHIKSKREKQFHLFDNEEDEKFAPEDIDTMFDVRPQFEGTAGEKLFTLQSRFGDDKRFAVDERFLEENSDSEGSTAEVPERDHGVEEIEDEKTRHLQILQDIIGNDVAFKGKKTASAKGSATMLRYDPSKEDHSQFEITYSKGENVATKKKVKKNLPIEPEPLPEVSKDTFYQVSDSLKNIFEKKASNVESFSLLKAMGRDDNQVTDDEVAQSPEYDEKITTRKRKAQHTGTNAFKYDSSDDEDETEVFKHSQNVSTISAATTSMPETFFFQKDDPRLSNSVSFFCRTEPLEVIQNKWKEVRHALYDDLVIRTKRSVRRKTPAKEKKGSKNNRHFKQSSRKQYKQLLQ